MLIIGKTGSGKTLAAAWQLAFRSFNKMPWIIFDFKRADPIFQNLHATELQLSSPAPRTPGLYIVQPLPHEDEEVDEFLGKIWVRGRTGILIDEAYRVTGMKWFRAILTTGRAKNIPMIMCTQRPVELDRFAISESEFFQLFYLKDTRDQKTIRSFLPVVDNRLPEFHSYWYDVTRDRLQKMKPVPPQSELLAMFRDRLGVRRRAI
jgi:hypothetical protein